MPKDTEPTIQDVLVAMNEFSTHVEAEFDHIKSTMVTKDEFYSELDQIKEVMVTKDELKFELSKIKNVMVTKDYLDDKLADLRAEFIVGLRHRPKLAK